MEKQAITFENRMLQQFCLIMIFISLSATGLNIFLNLDVEMVLITLVLAISGIIFWWLMTRYQYFNLVRIFLSAMALLFINVSWFYNYNSQGPVLEIFVLLSILFVFIWPLKTALYFIAFFLINVGLFYYIDINYHETLARYPTENIRITDSYFSTIVAIIMTVMLSYIAKSNYFKKYREAKKSDESKTIFLQNMSHELRTPLNAIIGFSDIIDENLTKEEMINYAKTINSSGNHLLSIVEDLFDITHIESGEIRIVKENIELLPLLNEVQKVIKNEQNKINKGNIELVLRIPPVGKNLTLNTDPHKLKQILLNLLKNALKFTNIGHIYYGYQIVMVKGETMLKFFVEDTGIGIEAKNNKFIFDVFAQIGDSATRSYGGAGLGLSISKKLSVLLGGEMWVESVHGKGSTFYFTVPYFERGMKNSLSEPEINLMSKRQMLQLVKPKKQTILIVEDVAASYEFLKIVLEKSGFHSIWAKDGEEAIRLCKEMDEIDLVLMDINMPVLNGFDATRKIKESRPGLPIIAQTAYAIAGDKEKLINAGCDDYISKPIKKETLIEMINKFLDNH